MSIVLCTYNGEKYVREQIDSLLAQSYPIHEIIIQDDGSTDHTWEILQAYASKHAVICTFKNEGTHGVNANFLSALHRATGDYIAISDQDDIWERDKIETQMRCIGDKMLCSGHSRPFSTDGSFAYFDNRPRNVNIFRMMFLGLPGHTLLCKRALINLLPPIESPVFKVTLYDAVLSIIAASYDSIVYMWCTVLLIVAQVGLIILCYQQGIVFMVSVYTAITVLWLGVWQFFAHKEIGIRFIDILKDICPYLLTSAAVMISTYLITLWIQSLLLLLLTRVVLAALLYYIVMKLGGSQTLKECLNYFHRKKG